MDNAFDIMSEFLPSPKSLRFFLIFSPKSYLVLYFTFKNMIHFKFICEFRSRYYFLLLLRYPINPAQLAEQTILPLVS